ncbi:hypothetical protein LEMLEM_LOCUS6432 [Lemmus lemmus]
MLLLQCWMRPTNLRFKRSAVPLLLARPLKPGKLHCREAEGDMSAKGRSFLCYAFVVPSGYESVEYSSSPTLLKMEMMLSRELTGKGEYQVNVHNHPGRDLQNICSRSP